MDPALFVAIFLPMLSAVAVQQQRRRRFPETFSSVSIITGRAIALKTTALTDRERRAARYRKSPESHLLNLND